MARAGSKKTRTGCLTCRSRKVKCDERKPYCRNCERLGLACEYAANTATTRQSGRKTARRLATSPDNPVTSTSSQDGFVTPVAFTQTPASTQPNSVVQEDTTTAQREHEIDRRRNHDMELQVLHTWMTRAVNSIRTTPDAVEWIHLWFIRVPTLAFQHRHLLYAVLAFAAMQGLSSADAGRELEIFQAEYWEMALQRQRLALMAPVRHVESVSMAAYLISMTALGVLRNRELEPYNPPTSWLDITRMSNKLGTGEENREDSTNIANRLADMTSDIIEQMMRAVSSKPTIDSEYTPILSYRLDEEQLQYPGTLLSDTLRPYEKTLSLITTFKQAVLTDEMPYMHIRRVCVMPHFLPSDFIGFLGQRRPRALLILALLFDVLLRSKCSRFLGDEKATIPRREIQAIARNLPDEWQGLMEKPLKSCQEVET